MSTAPTTVRTRPRDLRPGDRVRVDYLTADLAVDTREDIVSDVASRGNGRYTVTLALGGAEHVHATREYAVVTGDRP